MGSGAGIENPPPFLPPRRPASLPNLTWNNLTWSVSEDVPPLPPAATTTPFIPPRHGLAVQRKPQIKERPFSGDTANPIFDIDDSNSRPQSFQSSSSGETVSFSDSFLRHSISNGSKCRLKSGTDSPTRSPKLEPMGDDEPLNTRAIPAFARRLQGELPVSRQSSLRNETRLSQEGFGLPFIPPPSLATSHSDSQLARSTTPRPYSHPFILSDKHVLTAHTPSEYVEDVDPWKLPPLPINRASSQDSRKPNTRPRASFTRLSSLDSLITYRQEKAEWKRASSLLVPNDSTIHVGHQEQPRAFDKPPNAPAADAESDASEVSVDPEQQSVFESQHKRSNFRHFTTEVGFCFTIAMTQFLAEYLISGFAIELSNLLQSHLHVGPSSMGLFWPASLLSLILSATLLFWARLSDMYSGYFIFMFGVGWLAIWTLIPGFCRSLIWIDVSRAMQGLAIAAFMPSTFSMVGSIYPEGPRKNFVLGLYSGCAPLGFFTGFLVAGALPVEKAKWYWFVAAGLSLVTFITAFLSVPSDRTDRRKLGLKMDWIGLFLIMAGLILVSYALSVEPYANQFTAGKPGFAFPLFIGPFSSGIACLAIAFWYEGWCATCPLLPFEFFKPKSVTAFSLACMCFYASYGVWLYNSAQFFQTPSIVPGQGVQPLSGMTLALWYTPTAIGGIILCIIGGMVMHVVPIMILLLFSALAWIAAPLLLALAPLPLHYWEYVVPSMLCATIGIDLTFTVSIVFFSSIQPLRYQGLSGAVCSVLVNLAMSFALSISEIVMEKAASRSAPEEVLVTWGYQATFIYAAASAGLGLLICIFFVRISRSVVQEQRVDEEMAQGRSSDTTLVDPEDNRSDHQIHSEHTVERSEM